METTINTPPYNDVQKLINELGGQMTWAPGGPSGGGTWNLSLRGRSAQVEVRNNKPNDLDRLHVPENAKPTTWDDFGELQPDAFWRLIALFPGKD
jgi:hypothetical protein